jgi:lysozyme
MKMSLTGLAMLKEFEGWIDHVYEDATGHLTIGYGHLVRLGEKFPPHITFEQGELLLKSDLGWAEEVVTASVRVPLSQFQFDALVSLVFNIGEGNFKRSTLLRVLNGSDYITAYHEFNKWIYSEGHALADLVERRRKEAQLFMTAES